MLVEFIDQRAYIFGKILKELLGHMTAIGQNSHAAALNF
jgi:hypothetical protein